MTQKVNVEYNTVTKRPITFRDYYEARPDGKTPRVQKKIVKEEAAFLKAMDEFTKALDTHGRDSLERLNIFPTQTDFVTRTAVGVS
ncbi:hypothetical protein WJX72_003357 [[Myrmecia] bisecta]|uniref:Uncharacterized protein n=1 Tax=[Myrmecia] bisecta TaxID=41462 RepID=A0AAW1QPV2_9CHLO